MSQQIVTFVTIFMSPKTKETIEKEENEKETKIIGKDNNEKEKEKEKEQGIEKDNNEKEIELKKPKTKKKK